MATEPKQVSRKILEDVFGNGRLEFLDQVCDAGFKGHDPLTGDTDKDGLKDEVRMYRASFPDLRPTILGQVVEGDVCVTHWRMSGTYEKPLLGIPATGERVTVEGMSLDRFRGGKLMESFTQWDTFSFLQQLGVVPRDALAKAAERREQRPHA
jgi:predicted ester cyclase